MSEIVRSPKGDIRKTDSAASISGISKNGALRTDAKKFVQLDSPRITMSAGRVSNARRSQKKRAIPLSERAALSPEEFAAQFGKQKIWTYRQIYAGRVRVITGFGNMMIPRTEVERVLNCSAIFEGANDR